MPLRITTAIVEPNMLIREGLASLLERYSYRVIGNTDGAASFIAQAPPEAPKLVLVGAEVMNHALAEADKIRKRWPETKIVLLTLKNAGDPDDFRQMLASEIDGCVPLSVSQETLMRTVDLVMLANAKIMVMVGPPRSGAHVFMDETASETEKGHLYNDANGGGMSPAHTISPPLALINGNDDTLDEILHEPRHRNVPRLSERESQILNSIVHGCSNKIIARQYGITEATVKVHMKSILRKIQVANRTQAAVWAMENNYAVQVEKHLMDDDTNGAAA